MAASLSFPCLAIADGGFHLSVINDNGYNNLASIVDGGLLPAYLRAETSFVALTKTSTILSTLISSATMR